MLGKLAVRKVSQLLKFECNIEYNREWNIKKRLKNVGINWKSKEIFCFKSWTLNFWKSVLLVGLFGWDRFYYFPIIPYSG